jgi:hypothetical protein
MNDTLREARRVACTMTSKMNSLRGLSIRLTPTT